MKTVIDLMREYVRVADMCKGTPLENKPWECVKVSNMTLFKAHPDFNQNSRDYKFALAILEGRPVFVGSKLYYKDTSFLVAYCSEKQSFADCSWTPPTPKRTFTMEFTEEEMNFLTECHTAKISHISLSKHINERAKNILTESRDKE